MIFEWLPQAKENYKSLPTFIQKKANKAFRLFEQNPWHPSLHIEKIDPQRNIWSARIDLSYRFTFQWITGGILIRVVGYHEKAYRNP